MAGLLRKGLICFHIRTRQVQWFRHQPENPNSLASNWVRNILQDTQGTIWIATSAGLDQFQEQSGRFIHYKPESATPLTLPETDLYTLYQRPTGEILIGSASL
ncbi:hypothetical protein AHMF7605_29255 [Adhaeribacter arboris]|uniref:Uncharacterized protein n=1 Tax=Adhaeribacter arboris TaxID=2072846 RepID=A0A2T2Y908_9BACT|nr:two-component regulator propeller domain-containing protein [Adhaeribacter arboris]PSR51995.1 hypothetical protein AHMF7605_29255 [Adhaeribacter arboris]